MASGSITSWQIDGEKVGIVADCIFLGTKITVDGDCSCEIKRRLLLGRKAMTNLDSVLKSRDITLPTKVCLVKTMVFPLAMYGSESWTIKKAECRRIDALVLWCWESLGLQGDQPVHPKENQPWIFIRRTDAEAEAPILWPHGAKSQFIGKDPNWGQEEKRVIEDEIIGWL